MKCSVCGTMNSTDALFCKQCGSRLRVSECPRCMATVDPGARFCSNCGSELVPNGTPAGKICQSCGFVNTPDTTYCKRCMLKIL
jgi:ribosomal protein L40E